jgi:hypothetical protein
MKTLNRNQTLKLINQKIRIKKDIRKVPYRSWVYSFGIGKTKIVKNSSFTIEARIQREE